ncbi:Imm8 family immunity protein [Pseudomonas sp. B392_1p]|uniref:Imm8 family immunity protein n=1 Tax=Pseudomonas sp. B392_1p TaxID=3457507 RepID=UPI003FD4E203
MKYAVQSLWSPDLDPPSEGYPPDLEDFAVFVQVAISKSGEAGHEVFGFSVCSASALARADAGMFVGHTLVLARFDWAAIRARVEKLLLHVQSCTEWECVIKQLAGTLEYSDEW